MLVLIICPGYITCSGALGASSAPEEWQSILKAGTEALDSNKYWLAEPLLKKAVVQAGNFGSEDMRLAKSLSELGRLYTVRGRFSEAEPYLEEAFAITEQSRGNKDGQIIPEMGALIRFYLIYGTTNKALPLTEELLAFVEGKLKEPIAREQDKVKFQKGTPLTGWAGTAAPVMRDPLIEWAITCDELGNIYRNQENFALADRLFKAALDVKATVLGKEHLSLANSYDHLGTLYLAKNDYKEAEFYYKDALAITEKILPSEDPVVYARLDKLAKCLIKAGKYEQAKELYLRAQNFWKTEPSKYGNDARALFSLGCLYADEKNYTAAAPVLKQALDLSEQFNGPSSIALIPYLQKYAYTLYYLGRKSETEQLRARANTISGTEQQKN